MTANTPTSVKVKHEHLYKPCPSCGTKSHIAKRICSSCHFDLQKDRIKQKSKITVKPVKRLMPAPPAKRPTAVVVSPSDLDVLQTALKVLGGSQKALEALRTIAPLIARMGGVEKTIELLDVLCTKF